MYLRAESVVVAPLCHSLVQVNATVRELAERSLLLQLCITQIVSADILSSNAP